MGSEDDSKSFDMRPAHALVGEFMWSWANLERHLNKGVEKLLRLRGLEAPIAIANMQVRDKIHVIRTIAHLYCGHETDWIKSANKLLDVIGDRNTDRNIVAHNIFFAHDSGGVEFMTVKAKGRFQIPAIVWSEADFQQKCGNMAVLAKGISSACEHVDRLRRQLDGEPPVNFLASLFQPREDTQQLMGLLGLGSQALSAQGSLAPTPEAAPRKRKAPRPKPKGE